ncbi:MAG: hypothetical protein WCP93_02460 [Candidatus Berkelbacteria bacterium]
MDISDFKITAEWYKKMKADGYNVPLALYFTLERMVKEKRMTFQQAYSELQAQNRIQINNKNISFNLNEQSRD